MTYVKAENGANHYLGGMNEQPLLNSRPEKILSLDAETQFAPEGIVSRTLMFTPNLRMVLFGFAKGQELTEHTSTQDAVVQILSGQCELNLAGCAHTLKRGDLVFMPARAPHSVRAIEQFSMLLTLSKST